MKVLAGGAFRLGSPDDEPGRAPIEGPQRDIALPAFAVGVFPVTRGEWARFVRATSRPEHGGCSWASATGQSPDPNARWDHLNFPQTDQHPVVCVTWADVHDYVAWLGRITGRPYRLLSEAEWEYAARAGSTGPFPWGAEATHDKVNYGAEICCSGLASGADRWASTSPVDAFPPNAFGLYDMHGDAMEWVEDCFHALADAPADGAAYERRGPVRPGPGVGGLAGAEACDYRMLRGGDWGNPPSMIRSASRNYAPAPGSTLADYSSGGLGFRLAAPLAR